MIVDEQADGRMAPADVEEFFGSIKIEKAE
jgi:hypothetical protein